MLYLYPLQAEECLPQAEKALQLDKLRLSSMANALPLLERQVLVEEMKLVSLLGVN